jgi:hypothetical protein
MLKSALQVVGIMTDSYFLYAAHNEIIIAAFIGG